MNVSTSSSGGRTPFLYFNVLKPYSLTTFFCKIDHLFDVRYFAQCHRHSHSDKKGRRRTESRSECDLPAGRIPTASAPFLEYPGLQIQVRQTRGRNQKAFLNSARPPSSEFARVHGIFTDHQRLQIRELTGAAGAAVALAKARDAFVGFDLDDDARKSGMGSNRVTQGRFDRDEGRSPANVRKSSLCLRKCKSFGMVESFRKHFEFLQ